MIENAVFSLMAADSHRGIETELFYLDELASEFAVTKPKDRKQNKQAIEWILRNPKDSILILGGSLIVPLEECYMPIGPESGHLTIIQGAIRLMDTVENSNPDVLITQIAFATNSYSSQDTPREVNLKIR